MRTTGLSHRQIEELVTGTRALIDALVTSGAFEALPEEDMPEIRQAVPFPRGERERTALGIGCTGEILEILNLYLEIPSDRIYVEGVVGEGLSPFNTYEWSFHHVFIPLSALSNSEPFDKLRDPETAIRERDALTQRGFQAILKIAEREGVKVEIRSWSNDETIEPEELQKKCRYSLDLHHVPAGSRHAFQALSDVLKLRLGLTGARTSTLAGGTLVATEYLAHELTPQMVAKLEEEAFHVDSGFQRISLPMRAAVGVQDFLRALL